MRAVVVCGVRRRHMVLLALRGTAMMVEGLWRRVAGARLLAVPIAFWIFTRNRILGGRVLCLIVAGEDGKDSKVFDKVAERARKCLADFRV